MMSIYNKLLILGGAATLVVCMPASAQVARHPAVADYGAIAPMAQVANRPAATDDMRALFEITGEARGPNGVNRSLDRVARYLNLLASSGVSTKPGDIKVIIHGPATPLILRDEAYQKKFNSANPNTPLIAALMRAGVEIHVCGQATAGQGIAREDINPAVTLDLSAMTTLVLLQRQGWPLVTD
tara:strand:- start:459 stop:1010 length:552 start_codon:yes stop_codon:yes gene_type:complete